MVKTRKYGGDVDRRNSFKHILSIGYEMEASGLAKLSSISGNGNNFTLLNTDTARKDIEVFLSSEEIEFDTEEEEENYLLRQEEMVKIDAYDDRNKVDEKVSFLLTNDLATSPFSKKLKKICDNEIDKNDLYKFRMTEKRHDKGQTIDHPIQFVFWGDKSDCSLFSSVEWVVTYYNPSQKNRNIILDTFVNAIKNLLIHLDGMSEMEGNLVMTTEYTGEYIVGNPEKRIMFHKPDTNLYYLQTHYHNNDRLTIDDVCSTMQMTFSAHISHIFPIMLEMVGDTTRSIELTSEISDKRVEMLGNIENCANLLIKSYNKNVSTKYKLINRAAKREGFVEIKNYLILILYKLYVYLNIYLQVDESKSIYLKDCLFFNSRHTNYSLYVALKKCLLQFLSGLYPEFAEQSEEEQQDTVIDILQKLIIQSSILNKHLVNNIAFVRKNAFSITNVLDKTHKNYGDPHKSLISYFHFFEDPIDTDANRTIEDEIHYYDWLEYVKLDIYSSNMEIKDNVVLLEYRSFHRSLGSYIYSIATPELKETMKTGICNQLTKYYEPDVRGFSIGLLKQFVQMMDAKTVKKSRSSATTRKNTKSMQSLA